MMDNTFICRAPAGEIKPDNEKSTKIYGAAATGSGQNYRCEGTMMNRIMTRGGFHPVKI